ncbi:hypothetical protein FA95DRAFT_1597608 [Auriscalpium vulgare]|uniref:Uncharacterized protein n=1 Tax=Auriscalpium vulgare TaxID=40419 RepID=A0ACB8RIT7_9AGAM|nr:hypothetical protein FA95DRAFT_1597608 [Auriscalpium vulgare]
MYGVYMTLVSFTLYVLWNRPKNKSRVGLLVVTTVMFTVATGHVALMVATEKPDIIVKEDGLSSFQTVQLLRTCIPGINFILGDGIVAWRAWVIWGKSRLVLALPVILIIAMCDTVIAEFVLTAMYARADVQELGAIVILLHIVTIILSLGTNILMTCAIGYRAWTHSRDAAMIPMRMYKDRVLWALVFLVESGALYCVKGSVYIVLIFTARFSSAGTDIFLLVEASVAQFTGIYPTLIIVICALQRSYCDAVATSRLSAIPSIDSPFFCAPRPPSECRPRAPCSPSRKDAPELRGACSPYSLPVLRLHSLMGETVLSQDDFDRELDSEIWIDVSQWFAKD